MTDRDSCRTVDATHPGRGPAAAEPLERRRLLAASVSGLTLVDADTDRAVPGLTFHSGAVIDLAHTGRRLNVRAEVAGRAGSVRFAYDGNANYKLETTAPFAIGGNTGGDYWAWTPALGPHRLVVTPHAGARGTGARGASLTVTFTVIDSWAAPSPSPQSVPSAPTPAPSPSAPAPAWVNAGGGAFVDAIGRSFEADAGFTGGTVGQANYDVMLPADPASGFPFAYGEDPLLLDYRAGASFTFGRPLANGNYAVWLQFAEPVAGTAAGQRVFDVTAEGAVVLEDYDIVGDAGGARLATAKVFHVPVRDGQLDLAFAGVVGEAIVGAVTVVPTDVPAAALPYAGVAAYTPPGTPQAAAAARLVRSASNLRQIGALALLGYANSHKGRYPIDFSVLRLWEPNHVSHQWFASPRSASALSMPRGELSLLEQLAWIKATRDYVYLGANKRYATVRPTDWLAYENPDRVPGDQLVVLFGDLHVGYVPRAEVVARHGGRGRAALFAWPLGVPPADPDVFASQANLRAIGQASQTYRDDGRGRFAPDFGTLYAAGLAPLETSINPRGDTAPPPADATEAEKVAWINVSTDYVFRAAGQSWYRYGPEDVVAYENPAGMTGGINLLFGDGRVEFREKRWAMQTVARPLP